VCVCTTGRYGGERVSFTLVSRPCI